MTKIAVAMRMTPTRLILLRVFNLTLGRSETLARLLRRALVSVLIRRRPPEARYVASSRYFHPRELDRG